MSSPGPRENEFKWGLASETALANFLAAIGGSAQSRLEQVNHFFDTKDLALHALRHTFRIRQENDAYLVTLKGPQRLSGAFSERSEAEWEVPAATARGLLAGGGDPRGLLEFADPNHRALAEALLASVGDGALGYIGCFENVRLVVPTRLTDARGELFARFELDTTTYSPALVHHEIELEVSASARHRYQAAVEKIFAKAGITPVERPSKAARFFELVRPSA